MVCPLDYGVAHFSNSLLEQGTCAQSLIFLSGAVHFYRNHTRRLLRLINGILVCVDFDAGTKMA